MKDVNKTPLHWQPHVLVVAEDSRSTRHTQECLNSHGDLLCAVHRVLEEDELGNELPEYLIPGEYWIHVVEYVGGSDNQDIALELMYWEESPY